MRNIKRYALASATPSARNDNAMRGPSLNGNTPTECAKLTGRQFGECIKERGGASGNGASASDPTERDDGGKKNDRSTEGSSGTGNGMGTSAGANDTTAGGHVGASQSTAKGAPK